MEKELTDEVIKALDHRAREIGFEDPYHDAYFRQQLFQHAECNRAVRVIRREDGTPVAFDCDCMVQGIWDDVLKIDE